MGERIPAMSAVNAANRAIRSPHFWELDHE
jgi:hypothetical protein